jgi:hypothetical protein
MDLDLVNALTEAIARTGVHRYRYLCLECPDEKVRREYQGLVIQLASGPHAGPRFDATARATAEFDQDFGAVSGCGC